MSLDCQRGNQRRAGAQRMASVGSSVILDSTAGVDSFGANATARPGSISYSASLSDTICR